MPVIRSVQLASIEFREEPGLNGTPTTYFGIGFGGTVRI
jgi:hypothetical protein